MDYKLLLDNAVLPNDGVTDRPTYQASELASDNGLARRACVSLSSSNSRYVISVRLGSQHGSARVDPFGTTDPTRLGSARISAGVFTADNISILVRLDFIDFEPLLGFVVDFAESTSRTTVAAAAATVAVCGNGGRSSNMKYGHCGRLSHESLRQLLLCTYLCSQFQRRGPPVKLLENFLRPFLYWVLLEEGKRQRGQGIL